MNEPKNPEGKRWYCAGGSEEIDRGAIGVAAAAAGGIREIAEEGVAAAGRAH